jgi:hypothetical protein
MEAGMRRLIFRAALLLYGPALAADTDFDKCRFWQLGNGEAE